MIPIIYSVWMGIIRRLSLLLVSILLIILSKSLSLILSRVGVQSKYIGSLIWTAPLAVALAAGGQVQPLYAILMIDTLDNRCIVPALDLDNTIATTILYTTKYTHATCDLYMKDVRWSNYKINYMVWVYNYKPEQSFFVTPLPKCSFFST